MIGTGVSDRTYIVSGSGTSWKVSVSQTVSPATAMTATCYSSGATFTGTITGSTQLNVTSAVVGTIQIGQYISAANGSTGNPGILNGTYIVSGSGTTWTLNQNHNSSSTSMITYSVIPTSFEVTFTPSIKNATFYNSSTRLNAGDRLLLYLNYTGVIGNAGDLTCQLDLF